MKLIFSCEAVLLCHNGIYYCNSAPFGMTLWNRYLAEFDSLEIIARVEHADSPTLYPINSDRITIHPLPRYKGLKGAIKASRFLKKELNKFANNGDAYILRVPGQIGSTFSKILTSKKIKYGIEVVGDPWDVMGSIGGRLSFFLKRIGRYQLKKITSNCSVALYVTKLTLQKRYHVKSNVKTFAISDVIISKDFLAQRYHTFNFKDHIPNLVAVGSLEQLYKAPDIVISALSILRKSGVNVCMKWLGGGRYLEDMQQMAKELGVCDMIEFLGDVSREKVENYLEKSDLFIHISRTEGLPRAVVEAMAKGLPVIGSKVGGIPELVSQKCLVMPNDAESTANKIKEILSDKSFYEAEAKNNLRKAQEYEDSKLSSLKKEFFKELKRIVVE